MEIKKWARKTSKSFYSITDILAWIGYTALAAIVLIVLADVFGRFVLNKPLVGAYEMVTAAMTILGGFAIMYTTVRRDHTSVDLLVIRLPRRTQTIMQRVASLLGFAIWAVVAYGVGQRALSPFSRTINYLRIQERPFIALLAIALCLSCLTLLIQTFHTGVSAETTSKKDEGFSE